MKHPLVAVVGAGDRSTQAVLAAAALRRAAQQAGMSIRVEVRTPQGTLTPLADPLGDGPVLLIGDGAVKKWSEHTEEEQAEAMGRFGEFDRACRDREGVELLAGLNRESARRAAQAEQPQASAVTVSKESAIPWASLASARSHCVTGLEAPMYASLRFTLGGDVGGVTDPGDAVVDQLRGGIGPQPAVRAVGPIEAEVHDRLPARARAGSRSTRSWRRTARSRSRTGAAAGCASSTCRMRPCARCSG